MNNNNFIQQPFNRQTPFHHQPIRNEPFQNKTFKCHRCGSSAGPSCNCRMNEFKVESFNPPVIKINEPKTIFINEPELKINSFDFNTVETPIIKLNEPKINLYKNQKSDFNFLDNKPKLFNF